MTPHSRAPQDHNDIALILLYTYSNKLSLKYSNLLYFYTTAKTNATTTVQITVHSHMKKSLLMFYQTYNCVSVSEHFYSPCLHCICTEYLKYAFLKCKYTFNRHFHYIYIVFKNITKYISLAKPKQYHYSQHLGVSEIKQ